MMSLERIPPNVREFAIAFSSPQFLSRAKAKEEILGLFTSNKIYQG